MARGDVNEGKDFVLHIVGNRAEEQSKRGKKTAKEDA